MNLIEETEALQKMLAQWAAEPDWSLLCRYDLLKGKKLQSLKDRWYRRIRDILGRCGLTRPYITKYPWLATLKHADLCDESTTTVLIWALGVDQEDLRRFCAGFVERFTHTSAIVPVLVTDVPDFYYFSRLQWMVEYIPELSGIDQSYRERKQAYIAWRYRDAMALPVAAGTACEQEWTVLMEGKL